MEAIQAFLKKYDHIPPKEKCMALLLAEEIFLKVKQAFEEEQNQPDIIQELLLQLIHDLKQEHAAVINSLYQNPDLLQSFIYQDDDNDDDDYDEESILSMNTDMFETPSPDAITTSSPIEEPKDSLIIEDEDINTIPKKESDEENESSIENLFHIPSESKATSDNEMNILVITSHFLRKTFSQTFLLNLTYISSDVNPIYDEVLEDIDGANYLIDSIIDFSPKIDPFLEEFAGEFALINPIPPGITGADFDPEGDISLVEKLLYDNSSPRPPKELNSEISDTMIESFSSSPIPVKDSDSLMDENDIFLVTDDSIPPGIDSDSYDSEEDNLFLEYEPDPVELTRVVVEDPSRPDPPGTNPSILPPLILSLKR
ncbi:hypothetical protein Tco_0534267 [Tanacetum coccineum]